MTRYPCSGCGKTSCDGRCFTECPADYAEETGTPIDEWIARNPDVVAEIRARVRKPERIEERSLGDGWNRWAA